MYDEKVLNFSQKRISTEKTVADVKNWRGKNIKKRKAGIYQKDNHIKPLPYSTWVKANLTINKQPHPSVLFLIHISAFASYLCIINHAWKLFLGNYMCDRCTSLLSLRPSNLLPILLWNENVVIWIYCASAATFNLILQHYFIP